MELKKKKVADMAMQVALLQKVKCSNAEETRIHMKTNVPIQTDTHAQLMYARTHTHTCTYTNKKQ